MAGVAIDIYKTSYVKKTGHLSPTDKRAYVRTANELCYSDNVIRAINKATTEQECINILCNARLRV